MREQVDNSLTDVRSRIALYVEENELLVNDNRKLRDALGKACNTYHLIEIHSKETIF